MMEAIRSWAFSICFAAVSCGLIQMLIPNISTGKVLRFTVAIFFLICVLSPVVLDGYEPPIITQEDVQQNTQEIADKLTASVDERFQKDAKNQISTLIKENLLEIGIKPNKIIININTKDKDRILINNVRIELDEGYQSEHQKTVALLEQLLGIPPELVYIAAEKD